MYSFYIVYKSVFTESGRRPKWTGQRASVWASARRQELALRDTCHFRGGSPIVVRNCCFVVGIEEELWGVLRQLAALRALEVEVEEGVVRGEARASEPSPSCIDVAIIQRFERRRRGYGTEKRMKKRRRGWRAVTRVKCGEAGQRAWQELQGHVVSPTGKILFYASCSVGSLRCITWLF